MDITTLHAAYSAGTLTPPEMVDALYDQLEALPLHPVWIARVPREQALARAHALGSGMSAELPLYGVPFAVKDNIDVAGLPTTAGCPAFAYSPSANATVVDLLVRAGAVLIGKTNMDQFATGLVGTRTPYGACSSVFSAQHISGGSSSGSAVAVAQGLVSFALGTDTAGSGRVPAALNAIIGLKPTRGLISTTGVVPACRTLDCVSIFAETCADADRVLAVLCAFDPTDPYAREPHARRPEETFPARFRFAVPPPEQLQFFGDTGSFEAYAAAVASLQALGGEAVGVDLSPLGSAAALLYAGPWVAERWAAVHSYAPHFVSEHAEKMDPTVLTILSGAANLQAADAFRSFYQLQELRRKALRIWEIADVLCLPTVPRTYTHAEVAEAPIQANNVLGTYTNFVNLLDLAAVAIPAAIKGDGLPFGVSLIAPANADQSLLELGDRLHRSCMRFIAAGPRLLSATPSLIARHPGATRMPIVVVGAHLSGQPLNAQLTDRRATLVGTTRTAAEYRLYALANTTPPKPGLVYQPGFKGPGIEVEVWSMPVEAIGSFLALIPSPLTLGTIRLATGETAKGFLCEPCGLNNATEITHLGGWRAYLASRT